NRGRVRRASRRHSRPMRRSAALALDDLLLAQPVELFGAEPESGEDLLVVPAKRTAGRAYGPRGAREARHDPRHLHLAKVRIEHTDDVLAGPVLRVLEDIGDVI